MRAQERGHRGDEPQTGKPASCCGGESRVRPCTRICKYGRADTFLPFLADFGSLTTLWIRNEFFF